MTIGVLLRGTDPFRGMATAEALGTAVGRSGALLLTALAAAALLGGAAGTAYAFAPSRALRGAAWAVGTLGVALPSFFWAMVLQLVVVLWYGRTGHLLLPTSGFGLDAHLVLPALALAARPAAYLFRTTATALDEARRGDYVRTARAKGLLESVIASRHVVPNAVPGIANGVALAMRTSLSSLAIVEYVFSWNGAGFGFIHALANGRIAFATLVLLAFVALFTAITLATEAAGRAFLARRS